MRTSDCDVEMPLSSNENFSDSTRTFTVALSIIDSVTYFGERVQINLHQCKRLVDFYKRARQFFDALKRREVSVDEKLYNDTLEVLTKGQYLVYGYLKSSWLKSVKTDGVNQDAFAKIYVELEDCFRLIFDKSEAGVLACREHKGHKGSYPSIEFGTLAPLYFLDEDSRSALFEGDAQKDKEHMLEVIKGSGALDDKDNMLQRIEFTEITIDGMKASLTRKQGVCEVLVQKLNCPIEILDEESLAQRDTKALTEELLESKEALPKEMLNSEQLETKQVTKKKAEEHLLRLSDELLKKMEAENLLRKKEEIGELLNVEEALAMEKLRREQVEKEKTEELLNLKESENKDTEELWRKKQAGELLEKKEALAKEMLRREQVEEELLNLKLVLQQKELERRKQEEPAEEVSKQEAQKVPKQETKEVRKQEAKEVPKQEAQEVPEQEAQEVSKHEVQEVPKQEAQEVSGHEVQEVPKQEAQVPEQEVQEVVKFGRWPESQTRRRRESKQEVQEVPKHEVLYETKVLSSKGTGLPQDYKIRSAEISVRQKIGSGGFATIHRCRWQNYDYAVKIFEGGDVDRLRVEVQNLVVLPRHPNIVLLVGFSIHKDGRPMLVMELLDGDLHSLICTDKFKKKLQLTSSSEETLIRRDKFKKSHQLTPGSEETLIRRDKFTKKRQLTPGSEEILQETLILRLFKGCCFGGQPDLSTPIEVATDSTPIETATDSTPIETATDSTPIEIAIDSTPIEVVIDPTSIEVAIDFIYQIAGGMLFLHNRKIFHGDLKCKNVLVKQLPRGRVQLKIADFGVSEKLLVKREHSDIDSSTDLNCTRYTNLYLGSGKSQVHGNIGTLRWMAPEVYGVRGGHTKPYSMKADVYSFAMTCVEILTRKHPFPDWRSTMFLREHVKSGGRPDLSMVKDVPKSLRELVERCWDGDPLLRPDFFEIYSEMETLKKQFPIN